MRKPWLLLAGALFGLSSGRATAQTVEYEIPETYDLVEGRLAVTFGPAVSEAEARALVTAHGFEVVESFYNPVRVWAATDRPLTPEERARLEAAPLVEAVEVADMEAGLREAAREDSTVSAQRLLRTEGFDRYQVTLTFSETATRAQARMTVERVPHLWIHMVSKTPNELVIAVKPGAEEAAVETLEADPLVRYVSYLNATEQ
jgi:hypothetical protein